VQVETDLPLDELADSMTGRTSLLTRAQSLTTLQRASMGLGIAVIVGGGIVLTRRRRKTN
jgi:LPXTG-motif cell wall-anchored protein